MCSADVVFLKNQAIRCRSLASKACDERIAGILSKMAQELEAKAKALQQLSP